MHRRRRGRRRPGGRRRRLPRFGIRRTPRGYLSGTIWHCEPCGATKRDGRYCTRNTCKYADTCWQHAIQAYGVKIGPSLTGGEGLFAVDDFNQGDDIITLAGEDIARWQQGTKNYLIGTAEKNVRDTAHPGPNPNPYIIETKRGPPVYPDNAQYVDFSSTQSSLIRWINDCPVWSRDANECNGTNARFVISFPHTNPVDTEHGTGRLPTITVRATRAIAAGDEIFVPYGPAYWALHRPRDVPASPPASPDIRPISPPASPGPASPHSDASQDHPSDPAPIDSPPSPSEPSMHPYLQLIDRDDIDQYSARVVEIRQHLDVVDPENFYRQSTYPGGQSLPETPTYAPTQGDVDVRFFLAPRGVPRLSQERVFAAIKQVEDGIKRVFGEEGEIGKPWRDAIASYLFYHMTSQLVKDDRANDIYHHRSQLKEEVDDDAPFLDLPDDSTVFDIFAKFKAVVREEYDHMDTFYFEFLWALHWISMGMEYYKFGDNSRPGTYQQQSNKRHFFISSWQEYLQDVSILISSAMRDANQGEIRRRLWKYDRGPPQHKKPPPPAPKKRRTKKRKGPWISEIDRSWAKILREVPLVEEPATTELDVRKSTFNADYKKSKLPRTLLRIPWAEVFPVTTFFELEIKDTKGRGKGLFAAEHIPEGHMVLYEKGVTGPAKNDLRMAASLIAVNEKTLSKIQHVERERSPFLDVTDTEWNNAKAMVAGNAYWPSRSTRIITVWISRINHDCLRANVVRRIVNGVFYIMSLKPIEKGDEILIRYGPDAGHEDQSHFTCEGNNNPEAGCCDEEVREGMSADDDIYARALYSKWRKWYNRRNRD